MIVLYKGSGASGFEISGPSRSDKEWAEIRDTAIKLLKKRDKSHSADLLAKSSFGVFDATNYFGDEFSVLYTDVGLDEYVEFESVKRDSRDALAYSQIANTVTELGIFIRFIAVGLSKSRSPAPVRSVRPRITSDVVERALLDAENLIRSSGPVNAADRAHTALHGYLRSACEDARIALPKDPSITDLFKMLREQHPKLRPTGDHSEPVGKALRGISSVLDSLNPLRNRGSVAHPNEKLLDDAEAMLVINSARTVLHYLDAKLR